MGRRERRANDPIVQAKKEQYGSGGWGSGPLGGMPQQINGKGTSGGWGVGNTKSKPASGQAPAVNPFMIPKASGLNVISQTFPSNYYVEWNLSTWRAACDQAIKFGYPVSYATLVSWVFESSPFVQSLFRAISSPIGKTPFIVVDEKGNELPQWTEELCNKSWNRQLRKEIALSHFWGFVGINFDPINGKIYKYPMQDLDPISRMLRQNTYSYFDGINFSDNDNLLFIQPSTSYESFLGWMQPIARSFIQMNVNKTHWVSAGKRLAFPLITIGYPQDDGALDENGISINPYKLQAENIAANIDPSKGLVYPYTTDEKGQIRKAVEIEFEKPGTAAKSHEIFKDFNDEEKNEIREMILGGTLTSSVSSSGGSRALGEVHNEKFDNVIMDLIEYVETYLNDEYIKKISKFYTNFPTGCRFIANKAKEMSIDDIEKISTVLVANGKRLTDEFFEAQGLTREFFEDAPMPTKSAGAQEGFTVKKKFN